MFLAFKVCHEVIDGASVDNKDGEMSCLEYLVFETIRKCLQLAKMKAKLCLWTD